MSNLKINGLNMVYPSGETALYNVNLEAKDKEFLVILGEEKCGKSSLLRIIAGLEEPTGGEVLIDGKDMNGVDPKNRDLAMVFKSNSLYPALNVFDNMAFGLRMRKVSEALIAERVKTVAEILGLTGVLYRKPKVLSAAEKQRVAVGRAVAREPKIYLFDEPLSGLDDKLRMDMLNVIINLQARVSGTFVYATKNLSEALTIGTRIAVLKNGFVQQADTPANLYDYPANTFVAFYIGSPTINFIKKVKIITENEAYYGVCGDIRLKLPQDIVNRFERIAEYANTDKYVTFGIRPEDLKAGEGDIRGKIASVTDGEAKFAEIAVTPDISLTFMAEKDYIRGEEVGLCADTSRLHIFDAQTCLTLLSRDAGYKVTGLPDADFVPLPYEEEKAIFENLKPKKPSKEEIIFKPPIKRGLKIIKAVYNKAG